MLVAGRLGGCDCALKKRAQQKKSDRKTVVFKESPVVMSEIWQYNDRVFRKDELGEGIETGKGRSRLSPADYTSTIAVTDARRNRT